MLGKKTKLYIFHCEATTLELDICFRLQIKTHICAHSSAVSMSKHLNHMHHCNLSAATMHPVLLN